MPTIFTALLAATLFLLSIPAQAAVQPLDSIIAVVNKQVILASELTDAMHRIKREVAARGADLPPDDVLRKQVLDRLILKHLQLQRAEQTGITVSDADVTEALNSVAQRNHLTLDGLRQALQEQGIDFAKYRQQLHEELLITQLRQKEVDRRISVSDRDIDLYLDAQKSNPQAPRQYHLQHILIAIPSGADEATREKLHAEAEDLLQEIHQGKDFSKLAIGHSDGQQALKGGDLGWISANLLPTLFAAIVPTLKPGQASDIIASEGGFHIVKLLAVRDADQQPIADTAQLHLRHILIMPGPDRSPEQAQTLAEDLYKQLQDGADFAALAKRYSQDPGSAKQGGDLGWQDPSVFDPSFRQQVVKLKKGQLSKPFQTRYGWHIAQLIDRRKASAETQASRERERARQALFQRRAVEEYEVWLRRMRNEAYVQIRLPGSTDSRDVEPATPQPETQPAAAAAGSDVNDS